MTDLSGFEPNVEAIAGTSPTWSCSRPSPATSARRSTGSASRRFSPTRRTVDDVYEQIEQLGLATGNEAEAETLVGDARRSIDRRRVDPSAG